MKSERTLNHIAALLVSLSFIMVGVSAALGQDGVYAARKTATESTWDLPFYWFDNGAGSPYGPSSSKSTAVGTPSRLGCYYHTTHLMPIGGGFGLVHTNGTQPGAVYEVQVTQPNPSQASTDIIVNVGSTNADIEVTGATADGGWTNTTAFQAAYSANAWGRVCYLTNRPGVTQPHIDFKYVSGANGNTYADCVRFILLTTNPNTPTPVRITRFAAGVLEYTGGSGTRFVLRKSASLQTRPSQWEPVHTNSVTPSSFTIVPGSEAAAFYIITSE